MAKSSFKTKLSKKQQKNNILVFLGVIIGSYTFTLLFSFFIGVFDNWSELEIYVISAFMSFYVLTLTMSPIMLIAAALGVQKGKAKRVRDSSAYVTVQNITYYRDKLSELNPSLVSLLIDLDIYGQKVITATLLRMQNKKAISFNRNDRIIVTAENMCGLDHGETELLQLISLQNGKLNNSKTLRKWKKNRFREAECMGYIRKKIITNEEKTKNKYAYILLISLAAAFVLWAVFLSICYLDNIDSVSGAIQEFMHLLSIDVLLFVPMYLLTKKAAYKKRGDVLWERTPLGNETAEKIAGLSRFINEFSHLSEADIEQVVLWDDYLVYAIVLEENEKIVKNISKKYKTNLGNLDRLH